MDCKFTSKGVRKKLHFEPLHSFALFVPMKNRDYIILAGACLIIAYNYLVGFEDESLGGFLNGFAVAAILIFIVKGIIQLIRKRRNETT